MNAPRPYEIVAFLTVYEELRSIPRSQRRRIEDFLSRLTRHPASTGDFAVPTEDGRTHQVKIIGDRLVSFWADHAAREIRLCGIELIE